MRIPPHAWLLGLPILGACGTPGASDRAPADIDSAAVIAEVEGTVADLYDAMNAHDDARVMAHYLPGPDLLYAGVTNTLQGWESFQAVTAPWYQGHPEATFTYRILHVQVLTPDVATVTARGGSTEAPDLLWTRTLVRRDGTWLIALEHESWPGAAPPPPEHPTG